MPEWFETKEEGEDYLKRVWALSPQFLFFIQAMVPDYAAVVVLLAWELYRTLNLIEDGNKELTLAHRYAQRINFMLQPVDYGDRDTWSLTAGSPLL